MSKKHIAIYDNEGKTFDRYTVIIDSDVYCMSHNPLSPQGCNYWACKKREINPNYVIGKLRRLTTLPQNVQKAIYQRING